MTSGRTTHVCKYTCVSRLGIRHHHSSRPPAQILGAGREVVPHQPQETVDTTQAARPAEDGGFEEGKAEKSPSVHQQVIIFIFALLLLPFAQNKSHSSRISPAAYCLMSCFLPRPLDGNTVPKITKSEPQCGDLSFGFLAASR